MKKAFSAFLAIALSALPLASLAADKETGRLENCGAVLDEILRIPDNIPQDLLDKAECVIVIPSVLKAAFGIGGAYGRGAMTCRSGEHFTGKWGAPTMIALEGGSFGFQLGGQATDFVLIVMNAKGAQKLLQSRSKLGADASVAGGPVGRTAEGATDVQMHAEILTYSRSRGLFAGISLEGQIVKQDHDANARLYGRKIDPKDILIAGSVGAPAAAQPLIAALAKYSPQGGEMFVTK